MRAKLGSTFANSARNASRMAAISNELTDNWLRRTNAASGTPEAKDIQGQLQAVLDFYNKAASATNKPIDWAGFKERIHTPGVVDKIHEKYDKFIKTEYTVDAAVAKCGTTTDKLQLLDVALQYNFMLYFVHYAGHLGQIETVRNIGDISQLSWLEMVHLMPGVDDLSASQFEIGNFSPEDYNEDGMFTRICTQFSWGTRHTVPFNHSSDAINAVVATLGKLGK